MSKFTSNSALPYTEHPISLTDPYDDRIFQINKLKNELKSKSWAHKLRPYIWVPAFALVLLFELNQDIFGEFWIRKLVPILLFIFAWAVTQFYFYQDFKRIRELETRLLG